MRTIFRFEDAAERGMYYYPTAMTKMQTIARHPEPESDRVLRDSLGKCKPMFLSDHLFGFASLDQLRAWVPYKGWLKAMHKEGLMLSEIHCKNSDVFDGEKQIIFKGYKSKKQYDILEYFKLKLDSPQKKSKIKSVAKHSVTKLNTTKFLQGEFNAPN